MNEPKHTPGPWYADAIGRIWRRDPRDIYEYGGVVASDRPVATVIKAWYGEEEVGYPVEANARLIAAAPELLEALKALVANIDHSNWGIKSPAQYETVALIDARAAIAKAEGAQP